VRTRVCTTVTRSYLPHARVLGETFAAHHSGERIAVLVTDDVERRVDPEREPFVVVRPEELGLAAGDLARMAAIYDAKELATAFKPWLLRLLLEREPAALFIDPDVQVFAPIDDLVEAAAERAILLTPHSLTPIPFDGETPNELHVQRSGIFNTGFLGVGPGAEPFLDWLADRLRLDCVIDYSRGLFVDQRWIDFVPAYFEHLVVRDPGCNVAYWNLHERTLEERDERVFVNGEALRFFHFSGFHPDRPELLTSTASRIRPARDPVLARLCTVYAELLLTHGFRDAVGEPYGLAESNGVPLSRARRRLYRAALRLAEDGGPRPPEPHEPEFAEWIGAAEQGGGVPAADWARLVVESEPDPVARLRGTAGVRRLLYRLLRPQLEHDRLVTQALAAAVEEAADRLERRISALDARIDALEPRR
jgi:hypothetical protein